MSAPPSDALFRDSEGFPIVGGRCALAICNEHHYILLSCRYCKASFCQEHCGIEDHDCPRASDSRGILALTCPLCDITVKWDAAASTEAEALEVHRRECRGRPKQKEHCPNPQCRTVLGLVNAVVCGRCKQRVCTTHRFEDDHPCHPVSAVSKHGSVASLSYDGDAQLPATGDSAALETVGVSNIVSVASLGTEIQGRGSFQTQMQAALASPQRLRELRHSLRGTSASNGACLYALRRLLSDVSRHPTDAQYRLLREGHVRREMLAVPGSEELLRGIGFIDGKEGMELPFCVSKGRVDVVLQLLA
eukprot:TRINITY_DN54562_c0_g1_i1.p1 TRINITY_DN54562_c0_g1~~TRINITY_DN54562_c0_g1_i1.p1  ORF type:complete len:305 (+),score=19.11 TRINITY_DN54562_c0_g1_i1:96-1010(+)